MGFPRRAPATLREPIVFHWVTGMDQRVSLDFPAGAAPAPGQVAQVADGVYRICMPLAFAPHHINLWLLRDDGDEPGWTIVDAGFPSDDIRSHWASILQTLCTSVPVRRLIITHCHPDHFGLAGWLSQRCGGAPVWMSLGEYMIAQAWFHALPMAEPSHMVEFYVTHGLPAEQTQSMMKAGGRFRTVVPEMPDTIRRLLPSDRLHINGRAWQTLPGYGHSPEHVSLYCESLRVLICGDMLLPRISPNTPTLSFEPDTDAVGHYLDSIRRFEPLHPDTLVLPAHGEPYRGVHARLQELQAHHEERLAEIVAACSAPRSAYELIPHLFRRELDPFQLRFAMGEAIAHLNHLRHTGRLCQLPPADGVIRFVQPQ